MATNSIVYCACPMTLYPTEQYTMFVEIIRSHTNDAILLEPKNLYNSNADWLTQWPTTLASIDTLYFASDDGVIGAGVAKEVADAIRANKHVLYVDLDTHNIYPLDAVEIALIPDGDYTNYARVVPVPR